MRVGIGASALLGLHWHAAAVACGRCLPAVDAAVYNGQFAATLALLLLPLALIAGVACVIAGLPLARPAHERTSSTWPRAVR